MEFVMSISGLIFGLINIVLVVWVLAVICAVILGIMGALRFVVPQVVQRLFMALIALIALYMLVALLFGIPSLHVIGRAQSFSPDKPFSIIRHASILEDRSIYV